MDISVCDHFSKKEQKIFWINFTGILSIYPVGKAILIHFSNMFRLWHMANIIVGLYLRIKLNT